MMQGLTKITIRWKIYSLLILCLSAVHITHYLFLSDSLTEQFETARLQIHERDLQSLNGSLLASYQKLLEIAQTISLLTNEDSPIAHNQRVAEVISQHFQRFEMQGVLDSVALYDRDGALIQAWGTDARGKSTSVASALEFEYPVREIFCQERCARYIYIPLLNGNQVASILVLGRQLQDLVVEFKQNTGVDIGIAMRHQGRAVDIDNWQLSFTQLTQRNRNLPLLNKLSEQITVFSKDRRYLVNGFDTENEVFFTIPDSIETDNAIWVLISDITQEKSSLYESVSQIKQRILATVVLIFIIFALVFEWIFYRLGLINKDVLSYADICPELSLEIKNAPRNADSFSGLVSLIAMCKRVMTQKLATEKHINERYEEVLYALNKERELLGSLMNNSQNIILTQTSQGQVLSINTYGQQLFGDDITTSQLSFSGRFLSGEANREAFAKVHQLYTGEESLVRCDSQGLDKFGECRYVSWIHAAHSVGAAHESIILSIGMDVTEKRKAEERLAWLAFHNPVTASANKRLFWECLPDMIVNSAKDGRYLALLCCDIRLAQPDQQNVLPIIDDLNSMIEQRVSSCLREDDLLAHFSDDIYMVILDGLKDSDSVDFIANKILAILRPPFIVNNKTYSVRVNIGISLCPKDSTDVAELVSGAESAMHMSKMQGDNRFQYFTSSLT